MPDALHPGAHLKDRISAIDAHQARRCAPLSWQVVEDLMRHVDLDSGHISGPWLERLMWHVQAVEQQLLCWPDAQPHGVGDEQIEWPSVGHVPHKPLPSWQSMREWHARFQIRHQLQRNLAQALQHAGPLHSARLVQQSLALLNAISPAYVHRLLSQLDALAALEDAGHPRVVKPSAKKAKAKKSSSLQPPT